ncbi:MAG: hypothetical protein U1E65_16740 [Myxococcota bacterium]
MRAADPADVWWVAEANPISPLYFLPTREWVGALVALIAELGVKRVLEVGAGDGFLSQCLQAAAPQLKVRATDDDSWSKLEARLDPASAKAYRGVPFVGIQRPAWVERQSATAAVRATKPDLVLIAWAPPGPMVERAIRGPCRYVLEIGTDGDVTGDSDRTWKYRKELLEGPIESLGWCRLDGGDRPRQTRVTLYYGARHSLHGRE